MMLGKDYMLAIVIVNSEDIWSEQSFQTDPDLPPGWKKITDMAGIYYWHIPTGTTQWERPATRQAPPGQTEESQALVDHTTASAPRKHSLGSHSPSPTPDHESCQAEVFFRASTRSGSTTSDSSVEPLSSHEPTLPTCGFVNSCYFPRSTSLQGAPDPECRSQHLEDEDKKQVWSDFGGKIDSEVWKDLQAATVNPDPSLKEFEGATLRYASLKLRNRPAAEEEESSSVNSDPEAKCFAVRSLGWVEMAEEDLAPGKSSVAVNNCIRQLSYCKNDIRDTVGIWGERYRYIIMGPGGHRSTIRLLVWASARACPRPVQAAYVMTGYQKCLVARPPSQKACGSSPPGDSVSRRVSTSVKRDVLSLIDTLKQKRPVTELPQ
ncbi:amyloid beta A4 precursor protein-binding family B member 2-like isoform X11 [Lates japonicus]|uniref:Amyloid beta A4 protein-binding family B member 2-like isoform X11 n=1 Tax=Lates japonicus TaxID=270547 RepID=A0AAD3RE27_LATJO|nr:amyloid beta A4 precursor protein-binding family B member 2-like isoform X11 [Lates japonicus]